MIGANWYAQLFKTGQYGRFYIVSGEHARGKTIHIQILPENEIAESGGENNLCLNKDAVEVYGIISGQPGWTEIYGWLYEGKWQEDFEKLVLKRKSRLNVKKLKEETIRKTIDIEREEKKKKLLSTYQ